MSEEVRAVLSTVEVAEKDGLNATAQVKFVAPEAPSWALYVAAFDGNDTLYGLWVSFYEVSLGKFSLSGCEEAVWQTEMSVQPDLAFEPTTLRELKQRHDEQLRVSAEKTAELVLNDGDGMENPEVLEEDIETLLSRKGELVALWRRMPAAYQVSIALELLGTEFINEWSPWVREQFLQRLHQEARGSQGEFGFPIVTQQQLRQAGFREDEIAQFSEADLGRITHTMYQHYFSDWFADELRFHAENALAEKMKNGRGQTDDNKPHDEK